MNWQCPYCNHTTVIRQGDSSVSVHEFHANRKVLPVRLTTHAYFCRNSECNRYTLSASLSDGFYSGGNWKTGDLIRKWDLIPESSAKVLPGYVPAPIISDYLEACRIKDLSPKASATLARRCLQGMIRDFWGISKPTLNLEVIALQEKLAPEVWAAIDGVRSVGNIGAHMERDIDVIVDVEPEEAGLLIGLIESLVDDWYVARENKRARMSAVTQLAAQKQAERKIAAAPAAKSP